MTSLLAALAVLVLLGLSACSSAAPEAATATATPADGEPTAAPVDPDAVVLRWTREGGIAGFCDGLLLTAGHRATLGSCENLPEQAPDGDFAPNDAIREFEHWRSEFASFEIEWGDDDAVADGMTVRLNFVGRGSTVADEDVQRAIAEFASRLYTTIGASKPRVAAIEGRPGTAAQTKERVVGEVAV
ncbi:MAG: hypothetical protein O3A10_09840 [Chloroflexi bacterium]|nr:hypothetical protein [Chloroflexota bacterium]MQC83239.1 hypothetical protein [Chloroflexota bacterium]